MKPAAKCLTIFFAVICCSVRAQAHEIYFCGEAIPTSREFVANKLMRVIRNQIPNVTLNTLRIKAKYYFPFIENWLRAYGLPEDFKYIPIVECGFQNLQSKAGARGFWQIMPDVAKEYGLIITPTYDERDIPTKATRVACSLIRDQHAFIKRQLKISSWILTAAAYNFGIGNIEKNVKMQGTDYFNMRLNNETAEYVYRLIAVKELFERPELYMNGFGANIFSAEAPVAASKAVLSMDEADTDFKSLERGVPTNHENRDFGRVDVKVAGKARDAGPKVQTAYVNAHIVTNSKKFRDGARVTIVLDRDLQLTSSFAAKGSKLSGPAWEIDDRVFVDLGYGTEVEVWDRMFNKGLTSREITTNNQRVILKTEIDE